MDSHPTYARQFVTAAAAASGFMLVLFGIAVTLLLLCEV